MCKSLFKQANQHVGFRFDVYLNVHVNLLGDFFRPNVSSALFFKHNTALGPPYRVLVDTNFINFSIQNKVSVRWNFFNDEVICVNTTNLVNPSAFVSVVGFGEGDDGLLIR